MVNKWKRTSLEELGVELIDCDHKTPKAVEEGVPYIGIPQMDNGRINFEAKPRLISEKDFITWTRKANPKYGDVILSRRCNSGETVYVPKEAKFALGQNLVLLRPTGDRLHPEYLRWVVQGTEWWNEVAKYLNPGAIFESLKCRDIPKFSIPEPPKLHQIKISGLLSSISDKIELNQQTNQTLEKMAQTLFKSWFVDFDPVFDNALAKADFNLENLPSTWPDALLQRATSRLQVLQDNSTLKAKLTQHSLAETENNAALAQASQAENTHQHFPSEFEPTDESAIGINGWIPKGWAIESLDKVAHYQNGLALQKFRPIKGEKSLPVVKISQLKKGYADGAELASENIKTECIIDDGDIVFSWSGTLVVDLWCGGKAALNQHLFKVTSDNFSKWFYYLYTKVHLNEFQRIAADKAVTMGHIKRSHLTEAKCVIPSKTLLYELGHMISPLIDKEITLRKESQKLTKLRDTLLPKLISGELQIPDGLATVGNDD